MSAAIPNDQFLLYAFGDVPDDLDATLGQILDRAKACAELRLRITDDGFWRYPIWTPREVGPEQLQIHAPGGVSWAGCLAAVAALTGDQLDPHVLTWRLHVFPKVDEIPRT